MLLENGDERPFILPSLHDGENVRDKQLRTVFAHTTFKRFARCVDGVFQRFRPRRKSTSAG